VALKSHELAADEYEGHALDLAARMSHAMSSIMRYSQEIQRSIDFASLEEEERVRRLTAVEEQEQERAHCQLLSEALRQRLMELKQAAQETQEAVDEMLESDSKTWTAEEVSLLEEEERVRRLADLDEQRVAVKNGLHVSRLLLSTLSAMKEDFAKRRESLASQYTKYASEKIRLAFQPSDTPKTSFAFGTSTSTSLQAGPSAF